MKRILLTMAAVIAGVGIISSAANAGGPAPTGVDSPAIPVTINYWVSAPDGDPNAIADGLTGELFTDLGADVTSQFCTTSPTTLPQDSKKLDCVVPGGSDYQVGVSGIPAGYYVQSVFCGSGDREAIDDPQAEFTVTSVPVSCDVYVRPIPRVYIDKVVSGGAASSSDFTIEIFDTDGNLVTTVHDVADATCSTIALDDANCGSVQLLPGDYVLGEMPAYGYYPNTASCVSVFGQAPIEKLGLFGASFTHPVAGEGETLCSVGNVYVTQKVIVDIVVVNDSGGTATGADFTIEVFDNTGTLVDSGVDPEPGISNAGLEFDLPIGDYTFGVSGPAGYTATVAVTVVPVQDEIIDDPTADFTLDINNRADGVITVNDPTTTTTTTTLAPTTTQAPTTLAPTTQAPTTQAPTTIFQGILPATGSDQSSTMALLALGLLVFGSGVVYLARRR